MTDNADGTMGATPVLYYRAENANDFFRNFITGKILFKNT